MMKAGRTTNETIVLCATSHRRYQTIVSKRPRETKQPNTSEAFNQNKGQDKAHVTASYLQRLPCHPRGPKGKLVQSTSYELAMPNVGISKEPLCESERFRLRTCLSNAAGAQVCRNIQRPNDNGESCPKRLRNL